MFKVGYDGKISQRSAALAILADIPWNHNHYPHEWLEIIHDYLKPSAQTLTAPAADVEAMAGMEAAAEVEATVEVGAALVVIDATTGATTGGSAGGSVGPTAQFATALQVLQKAQYN